MPKETAKEKRERIRRETEARHINPRTESDEREKKVLGQISETNEAVKKLTENLDSVMAACGSLLQNEAAKHRREMTNAMRARKMSFSFDLFEGDQAEVSAKGDITEMFKMVARMKHTDTVKAAQTGGEYPANISQGGNTFNEVIKTGLGLLTPENIDKVENILNAID